MRWGKKRARPDRFTFQDVVVEASSSLGARPSRLVVTTIGTVIGIGSLVLTAGFAQTAANQVASQFDAAASTHLEVSVATRPTPGGPEPAGVMPWNSPDRVRDLAGVLAAGTASTVTEDVGRITALAVVDPSRPPTANPPVVAASAGMFDAVEARITVGRTFDEGHDSRADRVAVIGKGAAERLGITRVDNRPTIRIASQYVDVIGILDSVETREDLLDAVIVPMGLAREQFGVTTPDLLQIRFMAGAGDLVSRQVPIALAPDTPKIFLVQQPVSESQLRDDVQGDVGVIFLILGVLALLGGALGIGNVTQLSVTERIGEIGLRRALGATPRQIAQQFAAEATMTGVLGGLVGSALGVFAVVIVSAIRGWTPIVDPFVSIGAIAAGAVVGLVAGALPARRASRLEPVAALREGV